MPAGFVIGRVDENAQSNGIDALSFEQRKAVLGDPLLVVEHVAGGFHLLQPAYVGAFSKNLGRGSRSGQQSRERS
jgi:hypothetical protein